MVGPVGEAMAGDQLLPTPVAGKSPPRAKTPPPLSPPTLHYWRPASCYAISSGACVK